MNEQRPIPIPDRLQRARGLLRLEVQRRGSVTRLRQLRQEGSLKLLFPRSQPGQYFEAVQVNISGGIAAGDQLISTIACGEEASLLLTSQAAERCYRARPGEPGARVATTLTLEPRAQVEWLPQETILFDGAVLERRLDVTMHGTARLLAAESRVFGRHGSGETIRSLALHDRIDIVRDGRLVLADRLRLEGDAHAMLQRRAIGDGAAASATIILVAADAAARLDSLRALLDHETGIQAGASAWDGMLVIRMVARDAVRQRDCLLQVLERLRDGRPLPQVWRN